MTDTSSTMDNVAPDSECETHSSEEDDIVPEIYNRDPRSDSLNRVSLDTLMSQAERTGRREQIGAYFKSLGCSNEDVLNARVEAFIGECRLKGNELYAIGNLPEALTMYMDGLYAFESVSPSSQMVNNDGICALLLNMSACALMLAKGTGQGFTSKSDSLAQYTVKLCTEALDILLPPNQRKVKASNFIFKAYMRRAMAYIYLGDFSNAKRDVASMATAVDRIAAVDKSQEEQSIQHMQGLIKQFESSERKRAMDMLFKMELYPDKPATVHSHCTNTTEDDNISDLLNAILIKHGYTEMGPNGDLVKATPLSWQYWIANLLACPCRKRAKNKLVRDLIRQKQILASQ